MSIIYKDSEFLKQGNVLLNNKHINDTNMNRRLNVINDCNGLCNSETFLSQNKTNNNIETFDNLLNKDDINKDNMEKQKKVNSFNSKLSNEYNNMNVNKNRFINESKRYLNHKYKKNKLIGKNIKLSNGVVGYVNNMGNFKYYSDDVFNQNAGNKGCPKDILDVPVSSELYNTPGSYIKTDPELLVGKPMVKGQSCGNEGNNVYVNEVYNKSNINEKYLGCYNWTNSLYYQKDNESSSIDKCKRRALYNNASVFSLKNENGKNNCYLGYDEDKAKANGIAYTTKTSYSFKGDSNSNKSGLLKNGQIGLFKDNTNNSLLTYLSPIKNCDSLKGSFVNNIMATYGSNCN